MSTLADIREALHKPLAAGPLGARMSTFNSPSRATPGLQARGKR